MTQLRATLRTEFLGKIKSAEVLERSANTRAKRSDRDSSCLRAENISMYNNNKTLNTRISGYRQDLVSWLREKNELKNSIKDLQRELKTWKTKVEKIGADKTDKQLEIETAKTERARLELEGRGSKEEKKLKEIAAAHTSKMALLNEHTISRPRTKRIAKSQSSKPHTTNRKQTWQSWTVWSTSTTTHRQCCSQTAGSSQAAISYYR
jgi:chromosome segregation ATPase